MTKVKFSANLPDVSNEFSEFFSNIQSINTKHLNGFVLFCDSETRAISIQQRLYRDFHTCAISDVDNAGVHYIVPLENLDEKIISQFMKNNWNWDRDQGFIQYTITLYSSQYTEKLYNILVSRGFNVIRLPNDMQIIIKCLCDSQHNDDIVKMQNEFFTTEKSSPQSMDTYFNKVLFNGRIENPAYRQKIKQEFGLYEIEQNKDLIIREILYQYFKRRIRPHLHTITFLRKFDANKLDIKVKQNINLIREFLYTVAEKYIDIQIMNAVRTKHNVIIRLDYLNGCNDYKDFLTTVKLARKWRKDTAKQNTEKERNKKQSINQSYKVMDCENGYYFVILYGRDALQYCGKHMHHCVQNDYWAKAIKKPEQELYSLRDANGEPHLTLEIYNGVVLQCQGRSHTAPNPMLRKMVREFIAKNYFEIPDINGWNKHIAYIKQDGVLYDVFNLPNNFVLDNTMDLCGMGLDKLPEMSTITVKGNFVCATNNLSDLTGAPYTITGDCQFSGNPLVSLRGMPHKIGGKIHLSHTQLTEKSFVPLYMENKLGDIVGVDEKIIAAWRKQIATRKAQIASILASIYVKKL